MVTVMRVSTGHGTNSQDITMGAMYHTLVIQRRFWGWGLICQASTTVLSRPTCAGPCR
jgi:hypothetical protein